MNSDYPILLFPTPVPASRSKLSGGGGKPHVPSASANAVRLSPKFTALKNTLDGRRMRLQQEAEGANPEDVLVLETAGRIEDFVNAVKRIEGLEWLLEEDFDGKPDEDFYEEKNGIKTDKSISSRLYLISTNSQALTQIISLYNQFTGNPREGLERGYGRFKTVFEQLREVRFWDYQDRIDGNNFLEQWLRNNEAFPDNTIIFQIELWYRDSAYKRETAQQKVQDLVTRAGGSVLNYCLIEEIRYHAILVEVKASNLREIVNDIEEGSLIKSRDIMYFKPMPQAFFGIKDNEGGEESEAIIRIADVAMPTGSPVVALLDGYPLERHSCLNGRLSIDDPDEFESQYQVTHRIHGTEMASLIIHGDLSAPGEALDTPLYVRPIMLPDNAGNEKMPEKVLPVDLVHRAVRRMLVGENGIPASAPNVKIINFSIGDDIRMFSYTMSPMARLLDWLSYKYGVLFVISAGNTHHKIPITCSLTELRSSGQAEISKHVTEEILKVRMEHRLLSPAESINNLTVGSVHMDASELSAATPNLLNPYTNLHPALYTPFGGGLKKSIKPDLVYDGGRMMLKECPTGGYLDFCYTDRCPGLKISYPDNTLHKTVYGRGTSCSTALVSRYAYQCYKELKEILVLNNRADSHIHLLIKAMMVHGCAWTPLSENIEQHLPDGTDKKAAKAIKRQWIGYGYPNIERSLSCSPQRITVIGFGELSKEEAHVYELPLPPSLASKTYKRRLTVTLAWMSPINPQSQKYRKAKLWIETADNKQIADNRIEMVDNKATMRGTLQHEVFEGKNAHAFEDGDKLGIKVNCAEDAGCLEGKVKYAIAVSLELAEAVPLDLFGDNIYEEVRNRLRVPVSIATNTSIR